MLRQLVVFFVLFGLIYADVSCKQGYELYGDWCYRFDLSELKNYEDALKDCRNSQDDLVSIHDNETNTFIQNLNADGVLIGLRYDEVSEKLVWSDNTSFDYDRLDPNFMEWREYFGDCAINVNGLWKNAECVAAKHVFVCRSKAESVVSQTECPDASKIYFAPVTILSPGYPKKYDLSEGAKYCIYKIAAKNDHNIQINFTELALDGGDGFFYVYRGWDAKLAYAEVDNDFNGLNMVVDYNLVLLRLIGSLTGRWKITAASVSAEPEASPTPNNVCPDRNRVYVAPGQIISPGYPSNFDIPLGYQCRYMILAKNRETIKLTFTRIYSSNDAGGLYLFEKYADLLVDRNELVRLGNANAGTSYIVHSNHAGILLWNRYPGNFVISYSVV